jgi:hypothetical protein
MTRGGEALITEHWDALRDPNRQVGLTLTLPTKLPHQQLSSTGEPEDDMSVCEKNGQR